MTRQRKPVVLGSTSQHVVHHATCPVAVVRTETTE
jgi:nucleotide-binding universal stress UspA family protein